MTHQRGQSGELINSTLHETGFLAVYVSDIIANYHDDKSSDKRHRSPAGSVADKKPAQTAADRRQKEGGGGWRGVGGGGGGHTF